MIEPVGVISTMASTSNSTLNLAGQRIGTRTAGSRHACRLMNQILIYSSAVLMTIVLLPLIVVVLLILMLDKPSYHKINQLLSGKR